MSNTVEISRSCNDNLTRVYVGDLVLWFSYETIVAFHAPGQERIVSQNRWSKTTERHLNEIDGNNKGERWPQEAFESRLADVMSNLNGLLSAFYKSVA